jgi:hypothetical protein
VRQAALCPLPRTLGVVSCQGIQMNIALQKFIDTHKPDLDNIKASQEIIFKYQNHLPIPLLELWKEKGFGLYSDGLIQVINPDEYRDNLWNWLMRDEEDMDRLPIAISAFGNVFYYRKLSDEGDEDISFLDPHTSDSGDLAWSLESFFNDWCCDKNVIEEFLEKNMFDDAIATRGKLKYNEMYYFIPALRLGGTKSGKTVACGNATIHLDFLLQLALNE